MSPWNLSFVALLLLTLLAPLALAQEPAAPPAAATPPAAGAPAMPKVDSPFANDTETLSYILGYSMGENLKTQVGRDGIELNADVISQGVKEAITGAKAKISEESMQAFMMQFQNTLMKKRQEAAAKRMEENKKFLDENAKKEGVKTLPSGLQYKAVKEGTGASPKATDTVQVNYKGRLIDGTVFDQSGEGQPAQFAVNQVIPGWTEAMQLMKEGAKWELYIPSALAYGPRAMGQIPPNSVLIFDVELLKVIPSAETGGTVELPAQKSK